MHSLRTTNSSPICSMLFIAEKHDHFDSMEGHLGAFREAGLLIEHSDSLPAAFKRLRHGGIGVIFLALSLSDEQVHDTVKKLRLSAPTTPIIVMNGDADVSMALEALRYGAEDYLIKGLVDFASLGRSINYALSRNTARTSGEKLATILDSCDDAIIGKTIDGTITDWNQGAAKIFGYSEEEAIGKSISMLIPQEAAAELDVILNTIKNGEMIRNLKTVRLNKNGERLDILATISPIVNKDGTVSGAAVMDRDITEHMLAEKVLRDSEERYRLLVAGVKDHGIFMLDTNGLVESWNEGAKRINGYEASEIIGKPLSVFYTEADQQRGLPESHLHTAITKGNFEDEGLRRRKDGSSFFADVVMTSLLSAEGQLRGLTYITRDISERKRAEQEIADGRMRLSLGLKAAAIGVWDYDLLTNTVWRSPNHDEIFGYEEPLPEWNFSLFESCVLPQDLALARESFRLGLESGHFSGECRIVRANDKSIRWISIRGETFRNEEGAPVRMMGTVADITDLKDKEQQQHLLSIMQEREEFMATLTHDMKNPVLGVNQMLKMFVEGRLGEMTDQQLQMLRAMRQGNSGLLNLIEDLTDVYRFEKDVKILDIAECDLSQIVSSCVSRIIPFADLRSIQIKTTLPTNISVWGDARRLERLLHNLLNNALKFAPDAGTIQARLFASNLDCVLEIEDNGPGIAPEEQFRLFERFSQASAGKRYAGGSGLGLYLCRQIAEAHGGAIECKSEQHKSTIFRVCLPTGKKERH